MSDNRTKRQKLEAVISPKSGATEGERRNARSLLAKMKPDPISAPPVNDFFARQRTYTSNSSNYADSAYWRDLENDPSLDQLLRKWRQAMENESFSRWGAPPNHRYDAPSRPGKPPDASFCKANGHDYVVIGTSIHLDAIRRCTICGEYDPPRTRTRDKTHTWEDIDGS